MGIGSLPVVAKKCQWMFCAMACCNAIRKSRLNPTISLNFPGIRGNHYVVGVTAYIELLVTRRLVASEARLNPRPRIEIIAKSVADEVEGKHCQHDGSSRKEHEVWRIE